MSKRIQIDSELQTFLQAVSGESRQKILMSFLNGKERPMSDLVKSSELGQSTISIQLAILCRAGLLLRRKHGKEVYYRPDRARIISMVDKLSHFLKGCC
ncbi:MAG TPA: ArsR family transcriptional regulator [Leptospiraceae bacterium]|jgi:ArsR family transcriptional regulator|nr:ArsR family transcriptional regulator [Leptospirales bacterium]HMU82488.1 ArsR family transcriptional regulator [Leptospiraceae bacterium]HMW62095.1 ArsR family transcriptional regulator [Leptospiraceae bacterium]HMX56633.1 ArsR family transcriptional regulator [Leptospiraceae bacterium]HMY43883.1 ArsR family transcriptional regulator [Leptospiraceae bacterium]